MNCSSVSFWESGYFFIGPSEECLRNNQYCSICNIFFLVSTFLSQAWSFKLSCQTCSLHGEALQMPSKDFLFYQQLVRAASQLLAKLSQARLQTCIWLPLIGKIRACPEDQTVEEQARSLSPSRVGEKAWGEKGQPPFASCSSDQFESGLHNILWSVKMCSMSPPHLNLGREDEGSSLVSLWALGVFAWGWWLNTTTPAVGRLSYSHWWGGMFAAPSKSVGPSPYSYYAFLHAHSTF